MPRSMMRMFGIVTRYRGRLIFSQILLAISAFSTVGFATLTQGLVDEGMQGGDAEAAIRIGFWMFVLAILAGLTMAGAAAFAVYFSQGTSYTIRWLLYKKLQTFSFGNYDRFPTGGLMVRLNADVLNVQNGMLFALLLGLYAPFMLLATLALVIISTPELLWLLLVVIAVIGTLVALIVPGIFRNYAERQERLDGVNSVLQENITGIQVVKAFTREDYEVDRFTVAAGAMEKPAFKAAFRVAFLSPLLTGAGMVGGLAAVYFGGLQVLDGDLEVGQVVAFSQYLALSVAPLALMAIVIPTVLRGDTSAERILEAYDEEPVIENRPAAKTLDMAAVEGRVVFENVSFAFPRSDGTMDPPVLKNINLTIEPGEQVGFLGATGAGKSALVNLIPRFHDATEGRITIDGVDIRDIPKNNLRQIVGIALQEAVLFKGDIRFNMKFADPDVDDEVMVGAAKAADSFGFVEHLPEKWDAPVARRGYNFSGGQRQRLSINRALVQQPKILILDDSTSALDASTEGRVQGAIPDFTDGCTTLYVAQRISAVIELDKIVLLQDGEIIGLGNHQQLLESSELYQEIYESQLGGGATEGIALAEEEEEEGR